MAACEETGTGSGGSVRFALRGRFVGFAGDDFAAEGPQVGDQLAEHSAADGFCICNI